MKKPIKFAIIGLIILASIAGGIYYMNMPIPVRMTEIRPQTAELSFTEQGVVTAENIVQVFSSVQGEIASLFAWEGQQVRAGDILLTIDDRVLLLQYEQVQSGIRGLEAQLANVEIENARMRQTLLTNRDSLQGELMALNAQADQIDRAAANQQETINEQVRIQQVLIDQHQSELERVRENFARVDTLYQSGVSTRADFEAAASSVEAAESQLEAAIAQRDLIASGMIEDSAEHFEGMRTSINAQIAGIEQQLAQDTTSAARAHFEALIAVEQINIARLNHELENTIVTAPVSGILTTFHAQNTNFISAAAPVAEITVPGSLSIDVYVSTQDVNTIHLGDTVGLTIRQRLDDIVFYGRVTEIDSTAVVRLTALGVEERKVNVQVEPLIPEGVQIGIGHALDVTFYIFREENRLTVPRTAIFRDNGRDMVWAVRGGSDGSVEAVNVALGRELRTETIIESGLNPGDFVINDANNQDLREGVRVTNDR